MSPSPKKNCDGIVRKVQAALARTNVVQVLETEALPALIDAIPNAHAIDVRSVTHPEGKGLSTPDIFGPLAGIRATPSTTQFLRLLHEGWFPHEAWPESERLSWYEYLDLQWSALSSAEPSVVILHSLPPLEGASTVETASGAFFGLLADLWKRLRKQDGQSKKVLLLHPDPHLATTSGTQTDRDPTGWPVIAGRLLLSIESGTTDPWTKALRLFCDDDDNIRATLQAWLDSHEAAWRTSWVEVLRDLRILFLPTSMNGPAAEDAKEMWTAASNRVRQKYSSKSLAEALVSACQSVLPEVSLFHRCSGAGLKEFDSALLATALGLWAQGGDYLAPPSWMQHEQDVSAHDMVPTLSTAANPTRFRSLVHGWIADRSAWLCQNETDGFYFEAHDRLAIVEQPIPEARSIYLWYRLAKLAEDPAKATFLWRGYIQGLDPAEREQLLDDIGVAAKSVDDLLAAELIAALHPFGVPKERARAYRAVQVTPRTSWGFSKPEMPRFLDLVIQMLGEDGCTALLKEHLPSASGATDACLTEWMISQEWAERVARPLATYLGFAQCRALAVEFGVDQPGLNHYELLRQLCVHVGMPPIPRFVGPKARFREMAEETDRMLGRSDTSHEELRSQLMRCAVATESLLKQLLTILGRLLPWLRERIEDKLLKLKPTHAPPNSLELMLDKADLAHLTSCFGSLRKRAAQVESMLGRKLSFASVERRLDDLREARRLAAHDRISLDPSQQSSVLRRGLRAFVELWTDQELAELIPLMVMVRERRSNSWGQHVEIVDEFGLSRMLYLVELDDSEMGTIYYLFPRNNPVFVSPIMLRATEKSTQTASMKGRASGTRKCQPAKT